MHTKILCSLFRKYRVRIVFTSKWTMHSKKSDTLYDKCTHIMSTIHDIRKNLVLTMYLSLNKMCHTIKKHSFDNKSPSLLMCFCWYKNRYRNVSHISNEYTNKHERPNDVFILLFSFSFFSCVCCKWTITQQSVIQIIYMT